MYILVYVALNVMKVGEVEIVFLEGNIYDCQRLEEKLTEKGIDSASFDHNAKQLAWLKEEKKKKNQITDLINEV